MCKFFLKRLLFLTYCSMGCLLFATVPAYAHTTVPLAAQVALMGTTLGHAGTKVQITGSGFTPGSALNLYTTATPDPAKCVTATDPVAAGLTPFSTSPTVTTQADGSFNVDTTWPKNAATATTAYYICAFSPASKALSSNAFTVAQPVTIDSISSPSVAPGGTVTITGSNWLPVQPLAVSIVVGNSGAPAIVENNNVMPDGNGRFSVPLTIPPDAQPRSYAVRVYAVNEQTMVLVQNDMLTVTPAATPTPTPTVAPSPTDTPTAAATDTPTATPTAPPPTANTQTGTGSGGGNTLITYLLFTLGGLGVLLVVVGVIMFFVYSRPG